MSGTRPYSPGFGRRSSPDGGSAMQRQPEPSDGKPKVPDASSRKYHSPQHSKRGKTRFRDDRSKKHHYGPSSNRHNVKKYDNPINKCDPFSIRKDSPSKAFSSFNHQNRKDKVKHGSVRNDSGPFKKDRIESIADIDPTDRVQNLPIVNIPNIDNLQNHSKIEIAKELFAESPMIIELDESLEKNVDDVAVREIENGERVPVKDADMQLVDDVKINVDNIDDRHDISDVVEFDDSSDFENDGSNLYLTLKEYLQVESKFQPRLYLPSVPQRGEIAAGTRDGAVHVLRCLKVWYDLPPDVLFHAINLLDRFLTKMMVRLCHIACISVSCMHIAILSYHPKLPPINTEDLVSISQCKCTAGDVRRMSAIIEQKLGVVGETLSPLHWLRLLLKLLRWATVNLLGLPSHFIISILQEPEIINRLEILSCDASCCNVRACELALVLICTQLNCHITMMQESNQHPDQINNLVRIVEFATELQRACQICDDSFFATHQIVIRILERYNTRQKTPHRQCLVWKLSSRTLKVLRPTDKLTSVLPTIQEQQFSTNSPLKKAIGGRPRLGSDSSDDMSEDTKDWPTSPVVPMLCNNN